MKMDEVDTCVDDCRCKGRQKKSARGNEKRADLEGE